MRIRACDAADAAALLPGALAGEYALLPHIPDAPPRLPDECDVESAALIVATSGSTGRPKHVLLSRDALVASARATEARIGQHSWTCALPTHYVAGLMVHVRAIVAGTEVHTVPGDLTGLVPETMCSMVPTQLHRALDDPELSAVLPRLDGVLLGGAAIDPALLARARHRGVRVITTYGMSETCGGCVYDGMPLDGVRLRFAGERIEIAGPMLFSGYLGDTATSEWFTTSDRGRIVDGRLQVLGRSDDVVISGGENVDLAALQRIVTDLAPADSHVFAVPDEVWGARIVLATTGDWTLEQWQRALSTRVTSAAQVRQLLTLTSLPVTSSGKIDRQELRRIAREV